MISMKNLFFVSGKQSRTVKFSVYKSFACFLSSNAYKQLKGSSNFLSIKYQSHQLSPKEVKEQLMNLLCKELITIRQANLQAFEEIFN
jgi:hypothetical protein